MSIPDYQALMLTVLSASVDGEVRVRDVVEKLAEQLRLSQEERRELLQDFFKYLPEKEWILVLKGGEACALTFASSLGARLTQITAPAGAYRARGEKEDERR